MLTGSSESRIDPYPPRETEKSPTKMAVLKQTLKEHATDNNISATAAELFVRQKMLIVKMEQMETHLCAVTSPHTKLKMSVFFPAL